MEDSNFEKAFDSNADGNKRNLRVFLINPPSDNLWRKKEEYIEEREKLLTLQEKQIGALDALRKSSWLQTIALVVTIIASITGATISFLTYSNQQNEKFIKEIELPLPDTNVSEIAVANLK